MEKGEKFQRPRSNPRFARMLRGRKKMKIGKPGYINENCWLVKTLNYPPYKRCQYCELKFRNCLFLHYQIISLILILFFLPLSFLIEGKTSELVIISVFTLVIVYGYFFNKSTDKIIQANFAQRKAKEALEELSERLQEKVDEQTKEIRKAYEVEKRSHEELKRLDLAKTQFTKAATHHLRTPLTSIIGYLELILGGSYGKLENPEIQKKIISVRKSANILQGLIEDILDITLLRTGKAILNLEVIQIEEVIEDIVKEEEPQAKSKGIYLKWEKPKTALPKIMLDKKRIKEAIYNIVDNAVKYTEKGGVKIKVEYLKSEPKEAILTTIADTGVGLSKEEQRMFLQGEYFFERGKEAEKLWGPGKGIGLVIAYEFIRAHQGKLWVRSEGRGKGSTFYVELPVA